MTTTAAVGAADDTLVGAAVAAGAAVVAVGADVALEAGWLGAPPHDTTRRTKTHRTAQCWADRTTLVRARVRPG